MFAGLPTPYPSPTEPNCALVSRPRTHRRPDVSLSPPLLVSPSLFRAVAKSGAEFAVEICYNQPSIALERGARRPSVALRLCARSANVA